MMANKKNSGAPSTAQCRPIRRAKPTGERVDPEEAVRETLERYPNVMEHLAEAEKREESPSKLVH